ncbi:MAG: nucleotidyltransferase domain-containing protein [Cytophagaceae bacterium]|nr:nucleotidyltransferase domain-containing protein [Cytophagaceae bacterium]
MLNLRALTGEFVQRMQQHYGKRLARVVLYGSYARGDFHAESDVDLLVFV